MDILQSAELTTDYWHSAQHLHRHPFVCNKNLLSPPIPTRVTNIKEVRGDAAEYGHGHRSICSPNTEKGITSSRELWHRASRPVPENKAGARLRDRLSEDELLRWTTQIDDSDEGLRRAQHLCVPTHIILNYYIVFHICVPTNPFTSNFYSPFHLTMENSIFGPFPTSQAGESSQTNDPSVPQ